MTVVSSRPVRTVHLMIAAAILPCLALAAVSADAAAQAPAAKTTRERVFSAAQATRGEDLYMSLCVSCHPPATYKGNVFLTWQGRTLGELMAFLEDKMPKNDPGSLTPKQYADVIAYLLKLNTMPAGRTDLPTDMKILRGITIDIAASRGTSTPSH